MDDEKSEKVLCSICGKPIHIDDFGGFSPVPNYNSAKYIKDEEDTHKHTWNIFHNLCRDKVG